MSRWKLLTKVSLLAFTLSLGAVFAPRLAPTLHAQDEDEDDPMKSLTPEQQKELRAIAKQQQKCEEAIAEKDYETGVKAYKKLCDRLEKSTVPEKILAQTKYLSYYNYACCLSLTGAKDDAVKAFGKSVELGFFDWRHIAKDTDLDPLREMDSFKKAIEDGKKLEIEKLVSQVKSGKSPYELAFNADGAEGKKRTIASYKGKVLVLALLNAHREEALADEAAILQKASDELKEKGLEVVGMVFGVEQDGLADFATTHKIKFELVAGDLSDTIKAAAGTGASVFVVDRSGKVRGAAAGVHQPEVITSAAKVLLEGAEKGDEGTEKKPEEKKDGEEKKPEKKAEKRDDF